MNESFYLFKLTVVNVEYLSLNMFNRINMLITLVKFFIKSHQLIY